MGEKNEFTKTAEENRDDVGGGVRRRGGLCAGVDAVRGGRLGAGDRDCCYRYVLTPHPTRFARHLPLKGEGKIS